MSAKFPRGGGGANPFSAIRLLYLIELSTKIVDRLLTLSCMIPRVNLGVGEMGFML